ncbi:MAG: serine/threonine-protein kinase [Planctomycetaceae bacterium]|jgi:serine/threonine-protein kinase
MDRDEQLAGLINGLLAQARRGEPPDVESAAARHPHLADELREVWPMAELADCLAPRTRTAVAVGFNAEARVEPPVEAGRQFGDYVLLDQLGEGGMGVVYRARHRTLGRIVALKMIRRGPLATSHDLARFRAEALASAHLDHPQVIPIYEVGEFEGQPFFTMKYVPGCTLASRLAEGPLTARLAARLILEISRAIAHTHAHGIVHRDLKPSNILIDEAGRAHVGDFGLAKRVAIRRTPGDSEPGRDPAEPPSGETYSRQLLERLLPDGAWQSDGSEVLTRTGVIMGTPSYMSPEQATGRNASVGPQSDIYSLGALLYQCLTGRPPFQAASPVDLLLQVLEQEPVAPRMLNPAADAELEMIALKCLQKPPELRYATADDLADDLQAWLSNEPISARSTTILQLINRLFRETHHAVVLENWGLLWMLHSLVLLMLCTVTNWFQWRHIEARLPYLGLWILGLGAWALVFWTLRRKAGPITFVERQIAHIWGASMLASSLLFAVETLLGMPVLNLSPVLPLIGATVFMVKAGTLSGQFYLQAIALFATALLMAEIRQVGLPDLGLSIYGIVSALCFFIPGWKYWRQSQASQRLKGFEVLDPAQVRSSQIPVKTDSKPQASDLGPQHPFSTEQPGTTPDAHPRLIQNR